MADQLPLDPGGLQPEVNAFDSAVQAEIAQREAMIRAAQTGQTQAIIGNEPAQVTTEYPMVPVKGKESTTFMPSNEVPKGAEISTFFPSPAALPPPGPGETQAPIPAEAQDPIQAEIDRRQKAAEDVARPGFLQRADQWVMSVIPPEWRPAATAMGRIGANFNDRLANTLGVAPDAADEAMRAVGVKLWDEPGAATRNIKSLMHEAGIPTAVTNDLEGQLGRGVFDGVASAAAIMLAAPYMVATQGSTALGRGVQEIAKWVQKHPWLNIEQNIGSGAGAQVAHENIGGPFADIIGAAVGGVAVPSTVRSLWRAGTYPIRAVGRFINPKVEPPPVLPPGTDLGIARGAAEQALKNEQAGITTARQQAIAAVGGPMRGQPEEAQLAFRKGIEETLGKYREQERTLWAPFDTVQVDTTPLIAATRALEKSLTPSAVSSRPQEFIQRIYDLYTRPATPGTPPIPGGMAPIGQPLPAAIPGTAATPGRIVPTTIEDLMTLRSEMLSAAAEARYGATPNRALAKNLSKLSDAVLETISQGVAGTPTEAQIAEARAFSTRLNDLFTRGALGRVLRTASTREPAINPEQTVSKMLAPREGRQAFSQVQQIANEPIVALRTIRNLSDAETAVRSLFAEQAGRSPTGAQDWYRKNQRMLSEMASTSNDLATTSRLLDHFVAQENDLAKSALAKFAQQDPQRSFERIFSSMDPARDARQIMAALAKHSNADATKSFRAGIIDYLIRANAGRGGTMEKYIAQPRIRDLLANTLEPDQYMRLRRIITAGARLESGDATFSARFGRTLMPIVFRIFGAQAGRTLSHMLGGSNIQTPAIVSGIFRNWAVDMFKGISPEELLTRAILDPRWEAILMSKVPENTAGMRDLNIRIRRLIYGTHGYVKSLNEGEE